MSYMEPFHEILPNLFQGNLAAAWGSEAGQFDVVVNLSSLEYGEHGFSKVIRWAIPDGNLPDEDEIWRIAGECADAWKAGKRVLIHCDAGLNRSGLVMGATLVLLGNSGKAAIRIIRANRDPWCLCNGAFESWLKWQEARECVSP